MRNKLFLLFWLTIVNVSAQTLVYSNSGGNTAMAQISASMITVNIDNVTQFSLLINVMNTDPNVYLYSNDAGGVSLSKDFKNLIIVVFNPPTRLDFTLSNVINSYAPPAGYSNAPSYSKRSVTCASCKGTGICSTCKGSGSFLNGYTGTYLQCTHCSPSNGRICTICNGTGKW